MSDLDPSLDDVVGKRLDQKLVSRLLTFARPHAGAMSLTVFLLIAGMALRLLGPWLIQRLLDGPVDEAFKNRNTPGFDSAPLLDQVAEFAGIFLLVTLASGTVLIFREWLMGRTGQRIVQDVRTLLFDHILRLPLRWFDHHKVGWTVTRLTSDVDALSEMFTTGVATIAYDILFIIVIIAVLFLIAPTLALVPLCVLPILMYVSFRYRLKARRAFRATRKSLARLNAFLQESLSGLDVVRLFHREETSRRRFEKFNAHYYDDYMVTVRHFSLFFPTVETLSLAVKIASLLWGAWLIIEGKVTLGVFVQFWMYLDFAFEPIRELAERYNILQSAVAAGERVFTVLDEDPEQGSDDPPEALPPRSSSSLAVAFEHVHFSYGKGPEVVQDVSFRIAPGERVALVGHTGAGKTTLANLLCRFIDADSGQILVDEKDVQNSDSRWLRSHIGFVQQDVFLFSDTLSANIALANPQMTNEKVVAAATAVGADRFIDRLPERYDTRLSERGTNLSSGQRQLIAFARALAADPDILVLDEATSSVDSETEALIEKATARLMKDRTCLVIAHRLSTVVKSDRIVVLHKGQVHEEGTHQDLMANKGLYHKLYRLHLAGSGGEYL
ncbi:MAG: ABC transporter ATP-binding protein [Planctomycetota bacterium]|nr:ABC transporter ATP-binding protein [Planctomycetota bacterium]